MSNGSPERTSSIDETFKQTQNIGITFVQRRPNVFDVCPALYKCYVNVLCLLVTYGNGTCDISSG